MDDDGRDVHTEGKYQKLLKSSFLYQRSMFAAWESAEEEEERLIMDIDV